MPQSNAIFAFLLIAFIVFVTLRGHLPEYIELLRGGGESAPDDSSDSPVGDFLDSINPFKDSDGWNTDDIGESPSLPPVPNLPSKFPPATKGKMSKDQADAIIDLFEGGDTYNVFDPVKAKSKFSGAF